MQPNRDFEVDRPVALVDRLVVRPGAQQAAYDLLVRDYAAHVAPRGLRLVGAWLSPPFEQPAATSELTVVWEYGSLGALWAARMAEEDDPVVRRIWADLAAITDSRSRHVGRTEPMALPAPDRSGVLADATEPQVRTLLFVAPHQTVAAAERPRWIAAAEALTTQASGVSASRAGFHDEYSFLPDHFTWDIAGGSPVESERLLALLPDTASIAERIELGTVIAAGCRQRDRGGIKRTILVRVRAGTETAVVEAFEQALAQTPLFITAIDNWRLSRVASSTGPVGWTHCFEQEAVDASVFVGDYLNHPYHWSVVERLFHPDAPERVSDAFLHTLYPTAHAVLPEFG